LFWSSLDDFTEPYKSPWSGRELSEHLPLILLLHAVFKMRMFTIAVISIFIWNCLVNKMLHLKLELQSFDSEFIWPFTRTCHCSNVSKKCTGIL
jgi:hypothetical protein